MDENTDSGLVGTGESEDDGELFTGTAGFVDLSRADLRQVREQLSSSHVLAGCVDRMMADLRSNHSPAASFNSTP